jgi:hypothetical protein
MSEYREVVWEIFCRILEQTPQFTGRAVAHWDIQIVSPEGFVRTPPPFDDPNVGRVVNMVDPRRTKKGRFTKRESAQRKGNPMFIEVAKARNKPRLALLRRYDSVRFVNDVQGDSDGRPSGFYMKELQDPGYWKEKLRSVNQPYETAQESIGVVQWFYGAGSDMPGIVTFRHTRFALEKIW